MAGNKISLADWQAQRKPQGSTGDVKMAVKDDANLVYSTDSGKISAKSPAKPVAEAFADGAVRIRRETKGRGGKAVLTISGIVKPHDELVALAAKLKKKCAVPTIFLKFL